MSEFLFASGKTKLPEGCRVVHADSFDLMREWGDGVVDVTITDPPYAKKTHEGARTTVPGDKFTTNVLINFDALSDTEFLALCRRLVSVTKRWVVMTCDWRHAALAESNNLPVIRLGVWIKPDGSPQFTGDRPGTGWEAVLILHRDGMKRWNGGGHHAVWEHGLAREGRHPTEKPLGLVRKWVRQFSDPGEVIFDPFAGSGTTGEAALLEGRRCFLVERDDKYIPVIHKRLSRSFPKPPLRDRKTGEDLILEFPK